MPRRKTHEEYVEQVSIINPNIEVIDQYINTKVRINHRCKIDGHIWPAFPCNILKGEGCPVCGGHMKKTHQQYVIDVFQITNDIEVIGNYINAKTCILHRCKICGHEWSAAPDCILHGTGCPKCAGNMKRTQEQYVNDLYNINPNIIVLENYINKDTAIRHKCLIDNYEWNVIPNNLLRGEKCPVCSGRRIRTQEEYIYDLSNINPNIELIGEYVNTQTPAIHRCKIDGCMWSPFPNNILRGSGCPACNESKGERQISNYLINHNIIFERQFEFDECVYQRKLPFDFYLLDYNMCIEYDGIQHFEPIEYFGGEEKLKLNQIRDNIKSNYCLKNGINLIRIRYDENIEQILDKIFNTTK